MFLLLNALNIMTIILTYTQVFLRVDIGWGIFTNRTGGV